MADDITFLCYSDIHHDEYKNGLTGDDVVAVEQEFTGLCLERKVDFWIFAGDRFVSRNPLDKSRFLADQALVYRSKLLGIPGIMLPGNHDQWTKNPYGGHSMTGADLYTRDLSCIHVLDKAETFPVPFVGPAVNIHPIPAGQDQGKWVYAARPGYNICLFHGMVKGSYYQNGVKAEEGIEPSELDNRQFDIVIGGDNHQRQKIYGFHSTLAYYIGAPMQHNWGDVGSKRGFMQVRLGRSAQGATEYSVEWIGSKHPKFMKCEARIDSPQELAQYIELAKDSWRGNIVNLIIKGTTASLKDFNTHELGIKFKEATHARQVAVKLQFDQSQPLVVRDEAKPKTDAEEWSEFLKQKGPDASSQLDPTKLEKMGLDFINHA